MRSSRWSSLALGSLSFLIILTIWSAVTYTGYVQPFFLPTPTALVRGMIALFFEYGFLEDILISVFRIFCGFTIAALLAVPIGIFMGLSKRVQALVEPIVGFIRYTPTPALIPLFILWFGIGETEKVLLISQTVFFQLVLMVANAVAATPKEIIESARTLGARPHHIILHVIFPLIRPRIFDDLRISIGWAWNSLIAAEIVGATSGIGLVIIASQRLLRTPHLIGGIMTIGLIGLLTDFIMKELYPHLFPWAPKLDHHA